MPAHLAIPRRTLLAGLALIIAVAVLGIAYTRLPRAVITVQPATYTRTVSQEITLSTTSAEPDFVRFILPAKFAEKEVVESKTFTRQGSKTFEDFARGSVTMINKQDEEQRLLPKTHLRHKSSGVFFLTDTPVVIPPQGQIKVNVTAKEKGPAGNALPGTFIVDKLPESFHDLVYGESQTAFSGGQSVENPLTEGELAAAHEEVRNAARSKVLSELASQAGGASINEKLLSIDVTEEETSAPAGSKALEFTVRLKLTGRGFFPDTNDVLSLTLLALRSSPTPDEEFISYQPESFGLEIIRSDFARGEARIKGTLTGTFAQKTGPNLFKADNLAGRSEPEVQEYFKQFPSVGSVTVKFSPFWVTTVPSRPEATEIVVGNEGRNP